MNLNESIIKKFNLTQNVIKKTSVFFITFLFLLFSCESDDTIAVESVSINKATLSLVEGANSTVLVAAVTPQNAADKTVSWSSNDDDIATVVGGLVTAQAKGTAIITATTTDGRKTATVTVTVAPVPVTAVSINEATLSLVEGENSTVLVATITPTNAADDSVIWSSDDDDIATVVGGLVTAQAEGTAIITATTTDGGKTDTVTVTVAPIAVESVSINKRTLSLVEEEKSTTLVATVSPTNATDGSVIWSSDHDNIATVVGGLVTAQAKGTAIITATTTDGRKTATVNVTVRAATVIVESVSIDKRTLSLVEEEKSTTLVATVSPTNAADKTVIWSSDDNNIATVANGLVTAQAKGTATITATTTDGRKTDTVTVTVRAATVAVEGRKH